MSERPSASCGIYYCAPSLGDAALDEALDGVWLADLGQGDLRRARTRADCLVVERSPIADLAGGVVDHLQGRYTSALGRYERAFGSADSDDSALLVVSLARRCEVERLGGLADGREEVFTEALARGWAAEGSIWESRWNSFAEKAVSPDYRLIGDYLHGFLAQLPAIASFAINLRNHEERPIPPDYLLQKAGLVYAQRANERGFWPMALAGVLAAAQIFALAGYPGRAEEALRSIEEEPVADATFLAALAAYYKARLFAAKTPWGLVEHLGFLPHDGTGIDAGLPQPDRSEFDRSLIPLDIVMPLFDAAKQRFESIGMTRGAAAAECGLAYGEYVRGGWAQSKDRYARAGAGFAYAGDELRRHSAYVGECLAACRGYAPASDLRKGGTALGEFASERDAVAWGLGVGLTCVEAARETLLSGDVEAALGATEIAGALFAALDAPIRLAQVSAARASAYVSVQATNAALVELRHGIASLHAARSRTASEANRAAPALLGFYSNLIMLASSDADADEVERQRREVRELSTSFAGLTDEDCARVDAVAEEASRAAVELAMGVDSHDRTQRLIAAMERGRAQVETFRRCRQREHARWFDLMAGSLASALRARAYMKAGREDAAALEFQTGLARAAANKDLYGRAQLLNDAGRRDEALGALTSYIDSGYESWVDRVVSRPSPDRPARRRHAAALAADMEAWHLADAEYRKAGLAWDAATDFDPDTRVGGYLDLLNLALLASAFHRDDVAEALFQRLEAALENRRRLMSTENLRRALAADPINHRIYGEWATFLVARDRWSEAFDVSEVARARTLTESIGIARQSEAASAAYQRFREQAGLVERLTGQLAARYRAATADPAADADCRTALQVATADLRRYEVALLEASPNLRRLQLPRESLVRLEEVARLLPPKVLLLAFQIYDRNIFIWAVHQGGLVGHHAVKEFENKQLDARWFTARGREWLSSLSGETPNAQLGSQLSAALLRPFAAELERHEHVVVVPHRELSLLPMHALPWEGTRLGLHKSVSYLPAASMLKLFDGFSAKGPRLVIGDPTNMAWMDPVTLSPRDVSPLPAAGLEAAAIGATYEVEPLIGPRATESAVRSAMLGHPSTIHFATHGVFEATSVFDSGIALADGGSLTLDELGALDLHGALVVMSACDTGKASTQGSELVGVVRGVLSAGARAAVVSLWAAPDVATLLFMRQFHALIKQSALPWASLKATQHWLSMCTAGEALRVLDDIPQKCEDHGARAAMCRAEILGLAGDYRGALAAVQEAERGWKRLGVAIHADALTRERYRYAILADGQEVHADLGRRVFSSPRFWAPFALFGDWQ